MRYLLVASLLVLGSVTPAHAQFSISLALPGVSVGINQPVYPELEPIPGYPVYYAPNASANYFFYDGAYWVLAGDTWYTSGWYNGPWHPVRPEYVPYYVLRVPVRYYRRPPPYFRGWHGDAPPRWGQHWGPGWEREHHGWDRWDRRAAPSAAPLPVYQRAYAGDRYPAAEHQHALRSEHYRYEPREEVTRQHFAPPGNPGQHRGWSGEPQRHEPASASGAAPYDRGHGAQPQPAAQPGHDEGRGHGHEHDQGRGHGPEHEHDRDHEDERGHGR
jgi:hypothetical protein